MDRIDEQHRELQAPLRALHEAVAAERLDRVPDLVAQLNRWVLEHLATEEGEMFRSAYPGLPSHRAAHDAFVNGYLSRTRALADRPTRETITGFADYVETWIAEHARGEDALLHAHLAAVAAGARKAG